MSGVFLEAMLCPFGKTVYQTLKLPKTASNLYRQSKNERGLGWRGEVGRGEQYCIDFTRHTADVQ